MAGGKNTKMAGKSTQGGKKENALSAYTRGAIATKRPTPTVIPSANGIKVCNEEWIATVGGTTGNFLLGLGPGTSTYLWLGKIASIYAKYRVHKAEISFVSDSASTERGSLAVGVFYESFDAETWRTTGGYLNLLACGGTTIGPIYGQTLGKSMGSGTFTNTIDTKLAHASRPWFNCGSSDVSNYAEGNQANFALVGWRVSGNTSGQPLGNLMFRYEIEFMNPTFFANATPLAVKDTTPMPPWWGGEQWQWDRVQRGGASPRPDPPKPTPVVDEDRVNEECVDT